MSEQLIQRAQILVHQRKYEEAGKLLVQALAMDPNDVDVLAMLADIRIGEEKYDEAESLVNSAISISPDVDYLYHVKARVSIGKYKYDDAEKSLQQAISINPYNDHCFALWAAIKLDRKLYKDALDLADQALSIDPENNFALNTRSTALLKLDRKEEAFHTIQGALREDPENAYTHANYGWGLLEKGDSKKALEHFREALRHDPNMAFAQQGMVQALKAKYLFYRLFLRYSFWMSNLNHRYQWGVILGLFLVTRLMDALVRNIPALQPLLIPIIAVMALFAFSTWIITPISNLFLRLNPFGKHLLSRNAILSSNFVAGCVATALVGGIMALVTHNDGWLGVCFFGFVMMIPCSVMFRESKYNALLIYAGLMALAGIGAIIVTFATKDIFNIMSIVFLFGIVGFQFFANFVAIRKDNR